MGARAWRGFRSILCPVDFSDQSRIALSYASALAARGGGALTVLYANDPLLIAAAAAALHDRDLVSRSRIELQRFVRQTPSAGSRRTRLRVCIGSPAAEILKAAAQGVDAIVMGTHGMTGAARLLLGSTTLGVLKATRVPVLAVPPADKALRSVAADWPGSRILAACELDARTRTEADVAARVARWFGASLLLVNVVQEFDTPAWLAGVLGSHRIGVSEAEHRLDRAAAIARRHVDTEATVASGNPAEEIAALAASERIRLLVTMLRDRRGWFGARRGSVSYGVLTHAVVPVLACPGSWRPR